MVPRAETSLPKTDTKPTPFVGVRGKAGYFRLSSTRRPPQTLTPEEKGRRKPI